MRATPPVAAFGFIALLGGAGCSDANDRDHDLGPADASLIFGEDGPGSGPKNECGDKSPGCLTVALGSPDGGLPLSGGAGDGGGDPAEFDTGLGRDGDGAIGLTHIRDAANFLYTANAEDWGRGTLSRFDTKTLRETARYLTYTCYSLPKGNKDACDGTTGCCAADDRPRWRARYEDRLPEPPHQAVQRAANSPSRTAVDWSGDVYVANRAFGGQSSVTKIARDPARCIDRNGNGKIETSSDGNADGVIQTDCNKDGLPDDLASVQASPCDTGLKQEFFGEDDECILWTSNFGERDQYGRSIALGNGANPPDPPDPKLPPDAWVGTFQDGRMFRIDGTTGKTKTEVVLSDGCVPYGVAIDSQGYGWTTNRATGALCYFDTSNQFNIGKARNPDSGLLVGYGVTVDREDHVWVGGMGLSDAYRYTPDRTMAPSRLGMGRWVMIHQAGHDAGLFDVGRGIFADSRTPTRYFVWMANSAGGVVRLPGSELDAMVPANMDAVIDGAKFPGMKVAGMDMAGVGVDSDQNVWGVAASGSVITRLIVDSDGRIALPDLASKPAGKNKCPAGDTCPFKDNDSTDPSPYNYSGFTSFSQRDAGRLAGTWTYVVKACPGNAPRTEWDAVLWDADVPPRSSLLVRARAGDTPIPDGTWGSFSPAAGRSPALIHNALGAQGSTTYLQVEFAFGGFDGTATARLRSVQVAYRCP